MISKTKLNINIALFIIGCGVFGAATISAIKDIVSPN